MSKYPDNPYWCQRHDHPIAPLTGTDWQEAMLKGHLTPEHVFSRLSDILEYALGEGIEIGLDEDGFLKALVADGYPLERGVTVRLCTRDHPPPHVHIEIKGDPRLRLRMDLESGQILDGDRQHPGLKKKLRVARRFVMDHQNLLLARWADVSAAAPATA
jgi:hypothetical protein